MFANLFLILLMLGAEMIVTDYDLAFCKHALYCIYDILVDERDIEYYCNVYSKDALFCYAGGYHISIVIYKGQIRFAIDRSVSNRSVESSLYEYEDPSLYKLFSTIIKLIKDKCDKNATKTR
nr:MAG TPA: hypothetical protein [Caudoviricetes sp.]